MHVDVTWPRRGAAALAALLVAALLAAVPTTARAETPGGGAFVVQAYDDLFGRAPDEGGHRFWTRELQRGVSQGAVLASLIDSPEYLGKGGTITRLYWAGLDRDPDIAGFRFWLSVPDLSGLATSFANSDEFRQRYDALDDRAYVDALYRNVLDRPGDAGGLDFWTGRLASGTTRASVLASFAGSPEYVESTRSEVTILAIYAGLLGRRVDAQGLAYWSGRIDDGMDVGRFIDDVIGDAEYQARFPDGSRNPALHPFDATSPWNTPVGSGARYASTTDARTVAIQDDRFVLWTNAEEFSQPIYTATTSSPFVRVRLDDSPTGPRTITIRWPNGAVPDPAGDGNVNIITTDGDTAWDLWLVRRDGDGWRAGFGTLVDLRGSGFENGTRAAWASAIGGLIRIHELDQLEIPHAIALAADRRYLAEPFLWPSWGHPGSTSGFSGPLPYGTLVVVDRDVDVAALGLSPATEAVVRAMQDYGAYVVDLAGGEAIYAEPGVDADKLRDIRDELRSIRPHLRVVTNNTLATPGGGGTPRVAPAGPLRGS